MYPEYDDPNRRRPRAFREPFREPVESLPPRNPAAHTRFPVFGILVFPGRSSVLCRPDVSTKRLASPTAQARHSARAASVCLCARGGRVRDADGGPGPGAG